jgi:S-adenosylmethionine hydrolase
VVFVDRFGNLVTNINRAEIEKSLTSKQAKDIRFEIAEETGTGLSRTYSDDKPGKLLALIGSMDLLEIAVNQGSAVETLDTGKGEKVRVF